MKRTIYYISCFSKLIYCEQLGWIKDLPSPCKGFSTYQVVRSKRRAINIAKRLADLTGKAEIWRRITVNGEGKDEVTEFERLNP